MFNAFLWEHTLEHSYRRHNYVRGNYAQVAYRARRFPAEAPFEYAPAAGGPPVAWEGWEAAAAVLAAPGLEILARVRVLALSLVRRACAHLHTVCT